MAAENIDNTINGTGLFPAKVPGLSDAADIQAALRLYHYGSYTYDGSNTLPANLVSPSIAKHLQNLVDADAAEVTNRNAAITTHNAATTNVHGIANTANLATQQFVATSITTAISGVVGEYSLLAGDAIDWNTVDARFDVEPRLANVGTVITKSTNFTLSPDDVGKTILINSSAAINVFLPENSSVPLPVGYAVDIIQTGSGSVTVSEGSGAVSINSKAGIKSLDGQYSKGTLVKIDTDTWFFFGNLLNVVVPTPVPTPVAPVPVPTPAVVPVAPTPVVAPVVQPVAPTPVVAPVVQPVAPVVSTPTLPTPSLSVTSSGYNTYPNYVYANIGIGNYDYQNTYTTSSAGWTQNPEFPEEWNIQNISPNSSQTVYITASRAGYQSATGSLTFTSHYVAAPTSPTPAAQCTMPNVVGMTKSAAGNAIVAAGIAYEFDYDVTEGATAQNNGTVQSQDPAPGTLHPCGYQTNATIYTYKYTSSPVAPTPAVTPTVGTTYWATGCCEGASGGYQVTGTSTVNSQTAVNAMNTNCSEPGYGVPDYSTGSYVGTSNIPTNSCSPATPVPVAPVPVPAAPVAPTPVVVVIPGTIYLSYCNDGTPTSDTVTIDGSNFISSNINTACADYRNLLEYPGTITNIQCSTVSPPSAAVCGAAPAPVPVPTPVAPVAAQPTPIAPTPVPVVASTTLWHAVCFSDGGTSNDSSTVPNMLYSDCATYRAFVLGIDPGASINCSASGPVSLPGCVAPTPVPAAPAPVPAPVAPVPSSSNYPALKSGWNECTSGDAPNPAASQCNYNNIGFCVQNGSSGSSCTAPVAPTPAPVAPVAPSPAPVAPVAPSPAPVAAVPSPTALDCQSCVGYSGLPPTEEVDCADGCGTRTICRTVMGCPDRYLTTCPGCSPTPAAANPTPAAASPTPAAANPTPAAAAPTAACVANCVATNYICMGIASMTYYRNDGCGGSAACPSYYDDYGCA